MKTRYFYMLILLFFAEKVAAQSVKLEIQSGTRPLCLYKQKQGVISLAALAPAENQENSECSKKSVVVTVSSWIVGRFKQLVWGRAKQD